MEHRAHTTLLARLALAVTAAMVPGAALAETPTPAALSPASLAKSNAILGETSALARLLAGQKGITLDEQRPLQPASRNSFARPAPLQAVVRGEMPRISPAVESGRPDLFGSVALTVSKTPLDRRWRKVEKAGLSGAHADYARSLRNLDQEERIDIVNRYVNRRVKFMDDNRRFGQADVWMSASETLKRGRGDCEDYAIAKLQMLRAAGFSDDDLYLVVVKDLVRRADHAVLVVRTDDRMLMLDNGGDKVLDSDNVQDYRPVITFAANGDSWTHGYRRSLPPVAYAAASLDPIAPASKR